MSDRVNHNPDVLSCLANLSNDEVLTPPEVANMILDMLPQDLFRDPEAKFLDPACKSGIFLREIAKRLLDGLKDSIPDRQERIDHIFQEQLYGIAITELTSLLSRRSLYCSKHANSIYSVAQFNDVEGNIRFKHIEHIWDSSEKCLYCGTSKKQFDRSNELETHAYEFIHIKKIEELYDMKFDLIISNPPYQLNDGGNGVSATPIYQHFVENALKLKPRYLSMIIPSRWYAGGKGLTDFRKSMLENDRIRILVDYESSKECFSGVNIAGGVCYFLWDRDNPGLCQITNMGKIPSVAERSLSEFPIFIRSNFAISIIHKILAAKTEILSEHAYPRNPFGFATNFRGRLEKKTGDIQILTSKGFQYIQRSDIAKNGDIVDSYKVLIGRLVPSNGELDVDPDDGYKVITDTRIIGPGQINTETYLDIGVFKTEKEAKNFEKYLHTKFLRFLLRQAISSVNVTRDCFRFVPWLDFSEEHTDENLYKKFKLTSTEIEFVEKSIRPMNNGGSDE